MKIQRLSAKLGIEVVGAFDTFSVIVACGLLMGDARSNERLFTFSLSHAVASFCSSIEPKRPARDPRNSGEEYTFEQIFHINFYITIYEGYLRIPMYGTCV